MEQKILTLLTDFGHQDSYVGVMKGVIYSVAQARGASNLTIVDLTHGIPAQDRAAARFNLLQSWSLFPAGTVHIAVVDPGVGGQRRAIALQFGGGFLVGPDNGLFGGVLEQAPALAAVELTNPRYWRVAQASNTFHGRDIFAPVGAHLALGIPLHELGQEIDPRSLVQLPIPPFQRQGHLLTGTIQYVDHFGNLVSNIPSSELMGQSWSVTLQEQRISSCLTYGDRPPGSLVSLIGSHQWVEIAVTDGNAQAQLGVTVGTPVFCQIHSAL